tara:strand:- start:317 stop:727 length:411 start_codon:yes stop_codon:yes gene_type:complete
MNSKDSVWNIPNLSKLVDLHNQARASNSWMRKIYPLQMDNILMKYAQDWAEHMAKISRLKHSNMKDIMGLGFSFVSENIAYGQKTEESVMTTWLNSPGHRKNILSTSIDRIGCGFYYNHKDIIYWCVCFGKSKVST